ncbi:hypothetical protein QA645_40750 [Bradyrhizobium sp. CIAT3101]|uniref:hypothetical protein n=1 Tax=Bradyrhizobium TaxID=374 RepID=UPI00057609C7|nr:MULTISPECIES: hypothetical protein [Bradyrhizobium]WFU80687.1 hypothetical protein QA645_40750 [Bradyrhizobium sp. CIAT3101]
MFVIDLAKIQPLDILLALGVYSGTLEGEKSSESVLSRTPQGRAVGRVHRDLAVVDAAVATAIAKSKTS